MCDLTSDVNVMDENGWDGHDGSESWVFLVNVGTLGNIDCFHFFELEIHKREQQSSTKECGHARKQTHQAQHSTMNTRLFSMSINALESGDQTRPFTIEIRRNARAMPENAAEQCMIGGKCHVVICRDVQESICVKGLYDTE